MEKIIKRVKYSDAEEEDFEFWLSKTPQEKIGAPIRKFFKRAFKNCRRTLKVYLTDSEE